MKSVIELVFIIAIVLLCSCSSKGKSESYDNEGIIIENARFRLILNTNGTARSLVHKESGQECLKEGVHTPVVTLTQNRPYDNENFLTFPAKRKTFFADTIRRDGDKLIVGFRLEEHEATIGLKITDEYIGFTLEKIEYSVGTVGVKRMTEIDEFTLLQLPVKDRKYFGEWLNVIWDEDVAVNVIGTDMYAKIDNVQYDDYHLLQAGMETNVKLIGVGAALITTDKDELLDCIDKLERDYNLPLGVESRRSEEYKYSYYELRNVTRQNIDEHIAFAKAGGFRMMVMYYTDFATSMGHFPWNDSYPNGMADLQEVTGKIKAAGLITGLHIHYSKATKNDPYVTPVPDPRLNIVRYFTLAGDINKNSDVIMVDENPRGCTMERERRYLKIGDELITYENFTTERPYMFTGCQRGALSSKVSDFKKGFKFGLLDVDTWPIFIRFDQYTSIQEEVAGRLAGIIRNAGFRFIYFDGAEDVNLPYWFTASKAMVTVYDSLNPKPLVSEGAIKPHFGWHILSRGNAFDIFAPSDIRSATNRYPVREAEYIAQDFTSIEFGWMGYRAPRRGYTGYQPDMYEYVCSRAAAWDCPYSIVADLKELKDHPRTKDNLEVMHRWEEVRINGLLSPEQKDELKSTEQEHFLIINEESKYEMLPYKQITQLPDTTISAFIYERSGKAGVVFWNISGESQITINIDPDKATLYKEPGQTDGGSIIAGEGITLTAGNRQFLECDLPEGDVINAFRNLKVNQ